MKSPASLRAGAALRRAVWQFSLLVATVACEGKPSDLREWRVTDHDHTANPTAGQVEVAPANQATPAAPGLDDVTIVAWQQNCVQCHGAIGHGDGPRGPMLKATNLSDPAWQAARTDEQIALSIKEGKGLMPPFKLPEPTIASLVKLVRMMNAQKLAASAASGTSPSASASTPAPSSSTRRDTP